MKTERELFEEAFINAHGGVRFWLNTWGEEDYDYGHLTASWAWQMWQASTLRQGYKLVPVEPTLRMLKTADEHIMDRNATAESVYKAMIGAYNADNE